MNNTALADIRLTRADLSPDQRKVYESILDWTRSTRGGVLTVGGYAGTGKSTLLSLFAAETKLKIAYICFTGRASSVLGRKLRAAGVGTTNRSQTDDERKLTGRWSHLFYSRLDAEAERPFCGTIHRLIYRPLINDETEELFGWEKRDELDRKYDLIVLDEASMVDAKMVDDIRRHGVRVLAVGDHGQLPPVMGDGSIMANPMLKLEKIHRQAEGSPIIRLSRAIREELRMDRSLADGFQLTFGSALHVHRVFGETVASPRLETAFLCWRNQTRVHVNRTIRSYLGFAGKPPQTGEPIVCLRNYPPVYNGMRGLMTANAVTNDKEWWRMSARIAFPDEGVESAEYHVCRDQFHRHETFKSIEELETKGIKVRSMGDAGRLFDFGYAMTTHKSQGSQFPHVVVVVDWKQNYEDERTRRLAYTSVTRAQSRLTILV